MGIRKLETASEHHQATELSLTFNSKQINFHCCNCGKTFYSFTPLTTLRTGPVELSKFPIWVRKRKKKQTKALYWTWRVVENVTGGVQDILPQNVPLWCTDYFELHAIGKHQTQGEVNGTLIYLKTSKRNSTTISSLPRRESEF